MAKSAVKPAFLKDYDWIHFRQRYSAADDRSCAILLAAYLDNCATNTLLEKSTNKADFEDRLLTESRPLGSFSARIDLLWCFGFIDKPTCQDLHYIRRIRNRFAHDMTVSQFSEQQIASWCRELQLPKMQSQPDDYKGFKDDPRLLYILSAALCDGNLQRVARKSTGA